MGINPGPLGLCDNLWQPYLQLARFSGILCVLVHQQASIMHLLSAQS